MYNGVNLNPNPKGDQMADTQQAAPKTHGTHEHMERLLEVAEQLRADYDALLVRRTANRQDIRNAQIQGFLSPEQHARAVELYPARAPRKPRNNK